MRAHAMQTTIRSLKRAYPDATIALTHRNIFELLIATMLSAQCTDKRVNMVTPDLFRCFPTPHHIQKAPSADIERLIHSTGFYKNKTKNIKAASAMITSEFDGTVPDTMEELLRLPGVARKTANVVLTNGFGIIAGIVVDTHVARIGKRLGWTNNTDPKKIETDLMRLLPKKEWAQISLLLITHGRNVCTARSPHCNECLIRLLCPSVKQFL